LGSPTRKRNCFWPSLKRLRFTGWISSSAVDRSVLPLELLLTSQWRHVTRCWKG
jgi:hypothetical protein